MISLHAENQLPPSDRTEQPDPPEAGKIVKSFDPDLRRQFDEFKSKQNLSISEISQMLKVSSGLISKYLNKKPEGDVAKLEGLIRFLIDNEPLRENLRRDLRKTAIAGRVINIITSVANTNDFAILFSRAGVGKSCGCKLFVAEYKTAALLEAAECHGTSEAMTMDLWDLTGARVRKEERGRKKNDILVLRFKDSNRPVIIDDAHLLTTGGLRWARSFHDRTGCPVVLVGNPGIVDKIKAMQDEDQFTSRIGQYREIKVSRADSRELAALLLDHYRPDCKEELMEMAIEVCSKRGFARKLKKQLLLINDILAGGIDDTNESVKALRRKNMTDCQIAFAMAHTQLLTVKEEAA
ncbi:MAG TPA: AAA family ATPase [Verrucomicrobiae bacterium]